MTQFLKKFKKRITLNNKDFMGYSSDVRDMILEIKERDDDATKIYDYLNNNRDLKQEDIVEYIKAGLKIGRLRMEESPYKSPEVQSELSERSSGGKPKSKLNVKYNSTKKTKKLLMMTGPSLQKTIYYKTGDLNYSEYVKINSEYVKYISTKKY
jgi:hypothetical protein